MLVKTKGGVLVFGDLHLSDVHRGRHKNYLSVCFEMMSSIQAMVEDVQPSHIIFLGDVIGVREKNVHSREVLLAIYTFFKSIHNLVDGRVYVVSGNHDYGQFPDFQFLLGLGCFSLVDHFDVDGYLRCHLVSYGREDRSLDLISEDNDGMDIVFAHNNFVIPDVTTWYPPHEGILLSSQSNWSGVDMVVSGHIHNPSPEVVSCTLDTGEDIELFYAGCGTRPTWDSNLWESVWAVRLFKGVDGDFEWDALAMPLPPISEVFETKTYIEDLDEEGLSESLRREELSVVLDEIMKYSILSGDPISQLRSLPNTKPSVVDLAVDYVEKAFSMSKPKV